MRRRRRRRGAAVQERLAKSEAAGESKKSREHKIIKKKCGKRFGAFRSERVSSRSTFAAE